MPGIQWSAQPADPEAPLTDLDTAVGHLERGDWEAAHTIVQADESPLSCWAHGIVHLMEGDEGNAGYWYRRAGRTLPARTPDRIEAETRALRAALSDQQQA